MPTEGSSISQPQRKQHPPSQVHGAKIKSGLQTTQKMSVQTIKKNQPRPNPATSEMQKQVSGCIRSENKGEFLAWVLELVSRNLTIDLCFPSDPRSIRELPHTLLAKKDVGQVLVLAQSTL